MGDIIIQIYGEKGCINHVRQTKIETSITIVQVRYIIFQNTYIDTVNSPSTSGMSKHSIVPVVKCAITTTKDLDIGCPQTRSNHANLR